MAKHYTAEELFLECQQHNKDFLESLRYWKFTKHSICSTVIQYCFDIPTTRSEQADWLLHLGGKSWVDKDSFWELKELLQILATQMLET